jgi:hypothetical protein
MYNNDRLDECSMYNFIDFADMLHNKQPSSRYSCSPLGSTSVLSPAPTHALCRHCLHAVFMETDNGASGDVKML